VRLERLLDAELDVALEVDGHDPPAVDALGHDVGREVVHDAAVDEEVAPLEHGRQDAGERDAGSHGPPRVAPLVHDLIGAREVGRHREPPVPQVLDLHVGEVLVGPEQPRQLP
jgi:hypothetical protein